MPVYNTEAYLAECLDSIFAQTFQDFEVICVDDGSTDGSSGILKDYASRHPNMRVIAQQNAGAGAARNRGLDAACGRYYSFLDSDDFFEPTFLQDLLEAIEGSDISVCASYAYDDETKKARVLSTSLVLEGLPGSSFSPQEVSGRLFNFAMGWAWDKLFSADLVSRLGLRFQEIRSNNDLYFVFTAMANADRISVCEKKLCYHRKNTRGSLQDNISETYENIFISRRKLHDGLVESGTYETYRSSFLENLAIRIYDYSERLKGTEAYGGFLSYLRTEVFPFYDMFSSPLSVSASKQCYLESIAGARSYSHQVAVIIPVYNAERYIKQCLGTIRSQQGVDIEIICVDDGSTDGSLSILKALSEEDGRIKVFTQPNSGAGIARNLGISHADSEYLVFMDADDLLVAGSLKPLYDLAKESNVDLVKTKAKAFDDATGDVVHKDLYELTKVPPELFGRVISYRDHSKLFTGAVSVVPWNAIYRASFIELTGIRFNDLICVNDRSFYVSAYTRSERCMLSDITLVRHRLNNSDSLVGSARYDHFECEFRSYEMVRENVKDLPRKYKENILNYELSDIFTWHRKFNESGKDCSRINSQMKEFLQGLDLDDFENAESAPWYKRYKSVLGADGSGRQKEMPRLLMAMARICSDEAEDEDLKTVQDIARKNRDLAYGICKVLLSSKRPSAEELAFRICESAPSKGPDMFRLLSEMYYKGRGTEKNIGKAIYYFKKGPRTDDYDRILKEMVTSQSKGSEKAPGESEFVLGMMYKKGDGVPKDLEKALEYLKKSMSEGHPKAHSEFMNVLWTMDTPESMGKLLAVCKGMEESGDPYALMYLGRMARDGKGGLDRDFAKASGYLRTSYEKGLVWSGHELVPVLWQLGDEGSVGEMLLLAEKFAAEDNAVSLFALGQAHLEGKGVPEDRDKALELIRRSAELGYGKAKKELERLGSIGSDSRA